MGAETQLQASYEVCRRMHRRHDPTYYWATRRLPADVRPAVHALYGFVRGADELVDGPRRPADPAARRAALDAWERALEEGLATGDSPHPVIRALVDAGGRHDLPLGELRRYMRSMRVDCEPVDMASWEQLEGYMDGSAGAVGRIMAPLLGAPSDGETFGRLGVAFQLTNFIRDVPDDWALGRVYLPREDRERFGVTDADIADRRATGGFRALTALQVQRARALFAQTAGAERAVPPGVRPGMRMARAIYEGVLDRAEARGFDVLGRRPVPPAWRMGQAALGALRPGRRAA
jgi:15-cis-phytoene synthase